jgi:hypothetical protein
MTADCDYKKRYHSLMRKHRALKCRFETLALSLAREFIRLERAIEGCESETFKVIRKRLHEGGLPVRSFWKARF